MTIAIAVNRPIPDILYLRPISIPDFMCKMQVMGIFVAFHIFAKLSSSRMAWKFKSALE